MMLNIFSKSFWNKDNKQTNCKEKEEHCLLDGFFKEQQKLPPSMRSTGALISCPCSKCNPARL